MAFRMVLCCECDGCGAEIQQEVESFASEDITIARRDINHELRCHRWQKVGSQWYCRACQGVRARRSLIDTPS